MHTLTKCIHGRVEQFFGFSPVRPKKKNYSRQVFPLGRLGLGSSKFFVHFFLFFFASPHSADHTVIVVGVHNVSVCMYLYACNHAKQLS